MRRVFGGIVALSLSLGIAGQAKAEFTFTTLDVPGAIQTTRANGINDAGQIVGGDGVRGFLLSGGSYTTLGTIPSQAIIPTEASGINDAGQIVGEYSAGIGFHGFLLSGGSYTTLGVPGVITTEAMGINDAGQIVGLYVDAGGRGHGFLTTAVPEPSTLVMGRHRRADRAGLLVATSQARRRQSPPSRSSLHRCISRAEIRRSPLAGFLWRLSVIAR